MVSCDYGQNKICSFKCISKCLSGSKKGDLYCTFITFFFQNFACIFFGDLQAFMRVSFFYRKKIFLVLNISLFPKHWENQLRFRLGILPVFQGIHSPLIMVSLWPTHEDGNICTYVNISKFVCFGLLFFYWVKGTNIRKKVWTLQFSYMQC